MARFDSKTWNADVFQKYLRKVEDTKENSLMKNGLFSENSALAARLADGVGGNFITEPIKGLLDGNIINYDGVADITATSRNTFKQGKVVVGRAKAWQEKDFSSDLTGIDWTPKMAQEVKEYYDGIHQEDILAIFNGIFGMSGTFATKHTYDISDETTVANRYVGATTINKATQKACGDKKKKFELAFMHSEVSTNLENLQLLEYLKYTDANGIQRDLSMGTSNGKLVIIDDGMPVLNGYDTATSTDTGALEVVANTATPTTGQIKLSAVSGSDFSPSGVAAGDYVVPGTKYVTYIVERGFIEYADCGAKVPNEVHRDPTTDGGVDMLITRERKLYAPKYISFTASSMATDSPTKAELAAGANWVIVNDGDAVSPTYVSDKLIGLARVISRG